MYLKFALPLAYLPKLKTAQTTHIESALYFLTPVRRSQTLCKMQLKNALSLS